MPLLITLAAACAKRSEENANEGDPRAAVADLTRRIRDAYLDVDRLTESEIDDFAAEAVPFAAEIVTGFAGGLHDDDFLSETELAGIADSGVDLKDLSPEDWQNAWVKRWTPYLHTEYFRLDSEALAENLLTTMGDLDLRELDAGTRGTLAAETADYVVRICESYARNSDERLKAPAKLFAKLCGEAGREIIPAAMTVLSWIGETEYYSKNRHIDTMVVAAKALGRIATPEDHGLVPQFLDIWQNCLKAPWYNDLFENHLLPHLAKIAVRIGDERALPLVESAADCSSRTYPPSSEDWVESGATRALLVQTVLEWKDDPNLYLKHLDDKSPELAIFCFRTLARRGPENIPVLKKHIGEIIASGTSSQFDEAKGEEILIFAAIESPEVETILHDWISKWMKNWGRPWAWETNYALACALFGLSENYPETAPAFVKTLPLASAPDYGRLIEENSDAYTPRQVEIMKRAAGLLGS